MEKIAEKLAKLLVRENVISDSMLEIYQYGLVRMLEIGVAVLTGFVMCLTLGMLKEGIIFFIFFVPLRSYLGGIHLKKYWHCYIVSCFTLLLVLIMSRIVPFDMLFSAGMIIIASIGIGLEAKLGQKEQGNKVYSLVVWSVLLVLLVVMIFCIIRQQESVLVLLCCVTTIVLVSKVLEQIVQYRKTENNRRGDG